MAESAIEETPGPYPQRRTPRDRKDESGTFTFGSRTSVGARFSLAEWVAIVGGCVALVTYTYGQFRDLREEISMMKYQREEDRRATNNLAEAVRQFSVTVADLQSAVNGIKSRSAIEAYDREHGGGPR